jgi:hypothetical protein
MFKWSANFRVQTMCGARDTKMRNCLRGEQKKIAQILMQYTRYGYGCSPSTCSKSPLSRKNRLALSVPALETKTSRSPTGSREQGYLLEILKLRGDTIVYKCLLLNTNYILEIVFIWHSFYALLLHIGVNRIKSTQLKKYCNFTWEWTNSFGRSTSKQAGCLSSMPTGRPGPGRCSLQEREGQKVEVN